MQSCSADCRGGASQALLQSVRMHGGFVGGKWWFLHVLKLHREDRSKIDLYRYLFCVFIEKCVAQIARLSEKGKIPLEHRLRNCEAGATSRGP